MHEIQIRSISYATAVLVHLQHLCTCAFKSQRNVQCLIRHSYMYRSKIITSLINQPLDYSSDKG